MCACMHDHKLVPYCTQVANIIRNLSLEKDNIVALGENKQLLMYVNKILYMHTCCT